MRHGVHLLFCCLAPLCLVRTDWSEVKCDRNCDSLRVKFRVKFEFTPRLKEHRSLDIPLLLITTNQLAHEWLIHSNWSLTQHMNGWVLDSFSNRYIRTISIYTNDSKHMNAWFTRTDGWVLDCFLEWPQSFDSRITCFQFNGLLLRR